jgi:hypothetical protein
MAPKRSKEQPNEKSFCLISAKHPQSSYYQLGAKRINLPDAGAEGKLYVRVFTGRKPSAR